MIVVFVVVFEIFEMLWIYILVLNWGCLGFSFVVIWLIWEILYLFWVVSDGGDFKDIIIFM